MPELLIADPETDRAIQGPTFPAHCLEVRYIEPYRPKAIDYGNAPIPLPYTPDIPVGIARRLTFFKLDRNGKRVQGTERQYFVPERYVVAGEPTQRALRLVSEREGWDQPEPCPLSTSRLKPPAWEPFIEARLWWCGDEVCDCRQPQIVQKTPNLAVGSPWYRVQTLWEGTFRSEPSSDELAALRRELEDECRKRGLLLGCNPSDLSWDRVREIDREEMREARKWLSERGL